MEFKKEFWIRFGLIILGILIILIGLYNLWINFLPSIQNFIENQVLELNIDKGKIVLSIIFIFIGYLIYFSGKNWSNIFKGLTNISVSVAVLFFTLAIILFAINSSSENLVDSIQPSIDYMIANSVNDVLDNNVEILEGETVQVLLSNSSKVNKVFVKNLTLENTNLITKELGLENINDESKEFISKLLISETYKKIKKETPSFIDSPIPLSILKNEINKMGIDLNLLETIDISIFKNLFEISDEAYLNILESENQVSKELIIGRLNFNDVEIIWKNLGIESNISDESKIKITDILLSVIKSEFEKNNLKDTQIPIASLSSQIPKEYEEVFNYDLLNENVTIKQDEISRVRTDCLTNNLNLSEVCDMIILTHYDYLLTNIDNLSKDANLELPINLSSSLENINSLEKLETGINGKTDSYLKYFLYGILFYILGLLLYYAHFKFFKREIIPIHVPYYVSKHSLMNLAPTFLILAIFIYLVTSGMAIEFISKLIPSEGIPINEILSSLPLYQELIKIFNLILVLFGWYLLINFLIYILSYIFLKKEVDKFEKNNT